MVFFSGEVLLRVASFFLPPGSASKKARKSSVCSELYPDPGKAERREQGLWDNSQPQDTLWLCRTLGYSSVTRGERGWRIATWPQNPQMTCFYIELWAPGWCVVIGMGTDQEENGKSQLRGYWKQRTFVSSHSPVMAWRVHEGCWNQMECFLSQPQKYIPFPQIEILPCDGSEALAQAAHRRSWALL